jgi:AAA+ ATPase superfamily predicted ATPase
MTGFIGRDAEMRELDAIFETVGAERRQQQGAAVLLRGRRRIGKSSLVTEFIRRSGAPSLYCQASRGLPPAESLARLMRAVAASGLPGAGLAGRVAPASLSDALEIVASVLPDDRRSVVVLDEVPWLLEGLAGGAGDLQHSWDRVLSAKPVLLMLLGSDLAMMEELGRYDQPFHGRATELVLGPFHPRDVAMMTGLDGMDAFDAYLITGGQPLVAEDWRAGENPHDYVARSFTRSSSPLVISGSMVLDAEFPPDGQARAVLGAIGGRGERTYTGILGEVVGRLSSTTLDKSLDVLTYKRVIAADEPLSTRPARKDRRWRVADPALRFWLALVEPALGDIERGRPDLALERFDSGFASWRGRAIEPTVRAALSRLLPDSRWPTVRHVGGWWPRTNQPEIDLVGTDDRPAKTIAFIGTVKWRTSALTAPDVDVLARSARAVPGAGPATALVGVCPGGGDDPRLAAVWTADDLLAAWT